MRTWMLVSLLVVGCTTESELQLGEDTSQLTVTKWWLKPTVAIDAVSPEPLWTGQTVWINARMSNPTMSATNGWLSLRVDGQFRGEWDVSAAPATSDPRQFGLYGLSPGDHTLEVRYETPGE